MSAEHKTEIVLGMKDGEAQVDAAVASLGKDVNEWRVASAFGDRAFYHGNWVLRAAAAKFGIYGNDAVEAMYPYTRSDLLAEREAPFDLATRRGHLAAARYRERELSRPL